MRTSTTFKLGMWRRLRAAPASLPWRSVRLLSRAVLTPQIHAQFRHLDPHNRLFQVLTYLPALIDPRWYEQYWLAAPDSGEETRRLLFRRLLFHQQYETCWRIFFETYSDLGDIDVFVDGCVQDLRSQKNLAYGVVDFIAACEHFPQSLTGLAAEVAGRALGQVAMVAQARELHEQLAQIGSFADLLEWKDNNMGHDAPPWQVAVYLTWFRRLDPHHDMAMVVSEYPQYCAHPGWIAHLAGACEEPLVLSTVEVVEDKDTFSVEQPVELSEEVGENVPPEHALGASEAIEGLVERISHSKTSEGNPKDPCDVEESVDTSKIAEKSLEASIRVNDSDIVAALKTNTDTLALYAVYCQSCKDPDPFLVNLMVQRMATGEHGLKAVESMVLSGALDLSMIDLATIVELIERVANPNVAKRLLGKVVNFEEEKLSETCQKLAVAPAPVFKDPTFLYEMYSHLESEETESADEAKPLLELYEAPHMAPLPTNMSGLFLALIDNHADVTSIYRKLATTPLNLNSMLRLFQHGVLYHGLIESEFIVPIFNSLLRIHFNPERILNSPRRLTVIPTNDVDFQKIWLYALTDNREKLHYMLNEIGRVAANLSDSPSLFNDFFLIFINHINLTDFRWFCTESYGRRYIYQNLLHHTCYFIERQSRALYRVRDLLGCFVPPPRVLHGTAFRLMAKENPDNALRILETTPLPKYHLQELVLGIITNRTLLVAEKMRCIHQFVDQLVYEDRTFKLDTRVVYRIIAHIRRHHQQAGYDYTLQQHMEWLTEAKTSQRALTRALKLLGRQVNKQT